MDFVKAVLAWLLFALWIGLALSIIDVSAVPGRAPHAGGHQS